MRLKVVNDHPDHLATAQRAMLVVRGHVLGHLHVVLQRFGGLVDDVLHRHGKLHVSLAEARRRLGSLELLDVRL
eukprot:10875309-Prorocentrum_lima.AAC.1